MSGAAKGNDRAIERLLQAASFAARTHDGQLRRDGKTPYASHPFRVCLVLRHVFGVEDPQALTAALLHDTIEDTKVDFDDLAEAFGPEVARWVGLLSKDARFPEDERERAYEKQLASAPAPVRLCKLADVYDNLLDAEGEHARKTFRNARRYLDALQTDEPEVKPAWTAVSELLARRTGGKS